MEENVQKEIDTLKRLVKRWSKYYYRFANGHKYDQVHVEEFWEVVTESLMPYLRRLYECQHINYTEATEIYTWLGEMREDLSKVIAKVKPKEKEDPIITLLKNLELTEKQKKAVADYLSL